jgi:uncharacterized membrane protein
MLSLYTAMLLLHLLAATFWVGGMAVMHTVVRPTAAVLLPPPVRLPFLSAALGRFFLFAGIAIGVVLVSGLAMVEIAGGFAVVSRAVHLMAALGVAMTAIYGHLRFASYPRLRRAVAVQDWPGAGRHLAQVRTLVATNLLLGLAVFAVAVVGRMG